MTTRLHHPASPAFGLLERPVRLADQVVEAVKAQIDKGTLAPGSRLPSEHALAASLGVSRPVVREGLARLKADGFLLSRRGAGAFIADRPGTGSFRIGSPDDVTTADLKYLFELRAIVEVSAAELAAARARAVDIAAMKRALGAMSRALDQGGDGSEADEAFHRAIARASHNPQIERFVAFLGAAFADTRRPSWTPEGVAAGLAAAAQREHEAISAAIEARDMDAARTAARLHLDQSATRTGLAMSKSARGTGRHHEGQ